MQSHSSPSISLSAALFIWLFSGCPVFAKDVGQAISEIMDGQNDPNGMRLMVGSIALLFFLALTIIAGTLWYMYKDTGKK